MPTRQWFYRGSEEWPSVMVPSGPYRQISISGNAQEPSITNQNNPRNVEALETVTIEFIKPHVLPHSLYSFLRQDACYDTWPLSE